MRSPRLVLLVVTPLVFGVGRASAQTTYDACYVPSVGAIYLIKQAGLPAACLAQGHVAFSWTSGGAGGASDHGALTGLTDDDHPQYLLANGARSATDGFAVTGTFGSGALAASGAGARLLWYPRKGAFRAGEALGPTWDDANIGLYSVALGVNTTASGFGSTASGAVTVASGYGSTALGTSASAAGQGATAMGSSFANADYSTAMGFQSRVSARAGTAMGNRSIALGLASTAMGDSAIADRDYSTAMGRRTFAGGVASTALGDSTTAAGQASTAAGFHATASGFASTALGNGAIASGTAATSIGNGGDARGAGSFAAGWQSIAAGDVSTTLGFFTDAQSYGSLVIGRYNVSSGAPTEWFSTDVLLVAGNGSSLTARSNALTLLKNGNLTIAGTLTQSSDLRFKKEIEPLASALDGVLGLRPIRYRFRENTGHPTDRQIGLGAQDVERIFPELVHRDSQGHLSVAYTQLAAVLVRAVQEQQQMIEALRAEVAALRATQQR